MGFDVRNSLQIFLEYKMLHRQHSSYSEDRRQWFWMIVRKIAQEYRSGIYPPFVEEIKEKLARQSVYQYEYMIMCSVAQELLKTPIQFEPINVALFNTNYVCGLEANHHVYLLIGIIESKFLGEKREKKRKAQAELEQLEQRYSELKLQLEKELEAGRVENRKQLERELEVDRMQMLSETQTRMREMEQKINLELETAKEEERTRIEKEEKFRVLQQHNEELIESVKGLSEERKEFVDDVCRDIRNVSMSIKNQTDVMEQQMQEIQSLMEQEMKQYLSSLADKISNVYETMNNDRANQINEMVRMQRKIEGANFDQLIDNFCMLQEALYYNSDEEELGLQPTVIQNYLKKFMRILIGLGYECYEPEVGTPYDETLYDLVERREEFSEEISQTGIISWAETECVEQVITTGFKKDGEVIKKPGVTVYKKKSEPWIM